MGGFPSEIGGLDHKITDSQCPLPVVRVSGRQTGGSVDIEVHLLSKVEEADVIVIGCWIIAWVSNHFLHFDVQLFQSLVLLFSVVFSNYGLIKNVSRKIKLTRTYLTAIRHFTSLKE